MRTSLFKLDAFKKPTRCSKPTPINPEPLSPRSSLSPLLFQEENRSLPLLSRQYIAKPFEWEEAVPVHDLCAFLNRRFASAAQKGYHAAARRKMRRTQGQKSGQREKGPGCDDIIPLGEKRPFLLLHASLNHLDVFELCKPNDLFKEMGLF